MWEEEKKEIIWGRERNMTKSREGCRVFIRRWLCFFFRYCFFCVCVIQFYNNWHTGWEVIEKVGWSQAVESLCFLWRVGEAIEGFWLAHDRVIAGLEEDTPSTGVFQTWLWKVLGTLVSLSVKLITAIASGPWFGTVRKGATLPGPRWGKYCPLSPFINGVTSEHWDLT